MFVELSAWATWVNLTAAMVLVCFFPSAIVAYTMHGVRRDTTNHFEQDNPSTPIAMAALIGGEIGGFAVLLAGFVAGQFF